MGRACPQTVRANPFALRTRLRVQIAWRGDKANLLQAILMSAGFALLPSVYAHHIRAGTRPRLHRDSPTSAPGPAPGQLHAAAGPQAHLLRTLIKWMEVAGAPALPVSVHLLR